MVNGVKEEILLTGNCKSGIDICKSGKKARSGNTGNGNVVILVSEVLVVNNN